MVGQLPVYHVNHVNHSTTQPRQSWTSLGLLDPPNSSHVRPTTVLEIDLKRLGLLVSDPAVV